MTGRIAEYIEVFLNSFPGYWNYLRQEITQPSWTNYFYWLIAISLVFWMVEYLTPWRKKQSIIRKDFFLDGFYMFFNFFFFQLILFIALANMISAAFNDLLALAGINNTMAISVASLPHWSQLLILFFVRDFIHFNIHILLHRVPFLWKFHKVHHSVKEMGFAAHLRFHWMEIIVYRTLEYIPLSLIGFGITDFIIVHLFALAIGHSNHSNYYLPFGKLKYFFNSPQMHIWHHAKEIPNKYGVNFGLSLSIWDYLYGTNYVPENGRDIELGFHDEKDFPESFLGQVTYPLNEIISKHKLKNERASP